MNKIAFTGSAATARKVMAACAENLTPMVAECGGKDALIVDTDADLDAAADAAVWGALSNAGQTCVGVERVYVVEAVYHTFLERVTERAAKLRPGEDREADYGPMTMPGQIDVIERHLADAIARGGRTVLGDMGSVRKPFVEPIILSDVPEQSSAITEETFGPRSPSPRCTTSRRRSGAPTRPATVSPPPCSRRTRSGRWPRRVRCAAA